MLIAPIFHNNYLSPKRADSQQKLSETSLNNSVKSNDGNTSGTYSILKSAFNRGTELLKSTFFANPQQSTTEQLESPITISSTSSSPSSSSEESSDDDRSSPDSIKTELMLFKPITREPRTKSANAKLIRVPSIHSTSSSSSILHSPCPSPFSIQLSVGRQSAFSFFAPTPLPPPPKRNKRNHSKVSPEKKSETRQKKLKVIEKADNKRQTRRTFETTFVPIAVMTENARETRSKRLSAQPAPKPIKEFKSPQKPAKRRAVATSAAPIAKIDDTMRRVTRSMKT